MGMAECRYWHRSLNPKKLIDIGFSHLQPRMTIGRTIKLYKLPDQHVAQGFRKMEKKDIPVVHKLLKCAYSFWNVATSCTLQELMQESLIYARDVQMDAFNALDVMENESFLKELKFGVGDGYLQYYLYNWRCTKLDPPEVGLVLL